MKAPTHALTLADWLDRDIADADYLLGSLLSTSTRAMLVAPTGLIGVASFSQINRNILPAKSHLFGITGAGQIGGTLTRRLTALGFIANSRGPETLSELAAETGATAVSVPKAVRSVDPVVVTIQRRISRACRPAFSP